jgi:2-phosphosulfolactate phosphatase
MEWCETRAGVGWHMQLDVVATPGEIAAALRDLPGAACGVIDVVRATTTLVVLGERGATYILVAADVAAARAWAHAHPGTLLAGEADGLAPPGFDFGNDPTTLLTAEITGRSFAFATTNGTRAIRAAQANGAGSIVAAALRNADAIAAWAVQQPACILICAGRGERIALDDLYVAGFIAERMGSYAARARVRCQLTEAAQIARQIARTAGAPEDVLRHSEAGRAVMANGLGADLDACAAVNASRVIPRVTDAGPAGEPIITFG